MVTFNVHGKEYKIAFGYGLLTRTDVLDKVQGITDGKERSLQKIYSETYTQPSDAYFTTDPYTFYPSSTGLEFNISMDEAKAIIAEEKEQYTIPLKVTYPNISTNDIGFDANDDGSTTVLTANNRGKSGPVIIRTRTGERIRIDKPIFCIGKSTQGVDYQVTDNNSVSRRHAYIINVNGVYYLRDNKSTNHTYLGGKIISSGTDMMLIDGIRFKLANEEFTFKEK